LATTRTCSVASSGTPRRLFAEENTERRQKRRRDFEYALVAFGSLEQTVSNVCAVAMRKENIVQLFRAESCFVIGAQSAIVVLCVAFSHPNQEKVAEL
jgi:hypothetical protein